MAFLNKIESKDNAILKEIKKLHKKKYRNETGRFLVEGFRFVEEALISTFNVPYVFVNENVIDKYKNNKIEEILQKECKVYCVKENIFKDLCETVTPQGILAVVENKAVEFEDKVGFYVLVDKVQDPGNMGTIIRTAHASGALGIITTRGTVDIYNDKTLRSTMGSIFNVPIKEDSDLKIIDNLKNKGFKFVVSSLDTNNNFYDIDLTGKVIIAVGNEGNGISEEVYQLCDDKVKIPMPGGAESLNVAVSASIMMYEAVRQKNIVIK